MNGLVVTGQFDIPISVVIPTHNRAMFLGRAIESVLAQTYTDFELVVVDDASVDGTAELVSEYDDQRLVYIERSQQGGVSAARNTGISAARGKWISFLDDDDEFFPKMLQRSLEGLEAAESNPNTAFSWCEVQKIFESENGVEQTKIEKLDRKLLQGVQFIHRVGTGCGLTVLRKALIRCKGFDETFQVSEDKDLVLSLLSAGYGYVEIPEVLVKRHYHNRSSLSRNITCRRQAENDICLLSKHREFLAGFSDLHVRLIDDIAKNLYSAGRRELARRYAREGIRKNPFRWKGWRRYLKYSFRT